jgi:hypothetical protein
MNCANRIGDSRGSLVDEPEKPTALVIIPGVVNYFYDQSGRRIAEALGELGLAVEVKTLPDCQDRLHYDLCVLAQPYEIAVGTGNVPWGLAQLQTVRRRCRVTAAVCLEAVRSKWFAPFRESCQEIGVDALLDLGFYNQRDETPADFGPKYYFILNGLTTSEWRAVRTAHGLPAERPIPWAFIGILTPDRAALVGHLVQRLDPGGFVYMPETHVIGARGSPHLNEEQFHAVLRRTRYHIWCSQPYPQFYMESERFRMSLLAGCVPVKVVSAPPQRLDVPFTSQVVEEAKLAEAVRAWDFSERWQRFREEFLCIPSLSAGLAAFLEDTAIKPKERKRSPCGTGPDAPGLASASSRFRQHWRHEDA